MRRAKAEARKQVRQRPDSPLPDAKRIKSHLYTVTTDDGAKYVGSRSSD